MNPRSDTTVPRGPVSVQRRPLLTCESKYSRAADASEKLYAASCPGSAMLPLTVAPRASGTAAGGSARTTRNAKS